MKRILHIEGSTTYSFSEETTIPPPSRPVCTYSVTNALLQCSDSASELVMLESRISTLKKENITRQLISAERFQEFLLSSLSPLPVGAEEQKGGNNDQDENETRGVKRCHTKGL